MFRNLRLILVYTVFNLQLATGLAPERYDLSFQIDRPLTYGEILSEIAQGLVSSKKRKMRHRRRR